MHKFQTFVRKTHVNIVKDRIALKNAGLKFRERRLFMAILERLAIISLFARGEIKKDVPVSLATAVFEYRFLELRRGMRVFGGDRLAEDQLPGHAHAGVDEVLRLLGPHDLLVLHEEPRPDQSHVSEDDLGQSGRRHGHEIAFAQNGLHEAADEGHGLGAMPRGLHVVVQEVGHGRGVKTVVQQLQHGSLPMEELFLGEGVRAHGHHLVEVGGIHLLYLRGDPERRQAYYLQVALGHVDQSEDSVQESGRQTDGL